jgi:hypothetical protein
MRILAMAVGVALALGCALALFGGARASRGADRSQLDDPAHARLESEVARLRAEIEALRAELAARRPSLREPSAPAALAPVPVAPDDPLAYLQRYVKSFEGGGEGAEFFRLAVVAWAPELVDAIGALVLDSTAVPHLRAQLITVLGDRRLASDERVTSVLVRLLASRPDRRLLQAALPVLSERTDPRTALALESALWSVDPGLRTLLLKMIARGAGDRTNAALLRLLTTAPDDEARALVVAALHPDDWTNALAILEQASLDEAVEVRLAGAEALSAFGTREALTFADAWRLRERDERVLAALTRARNDGQKVPSWAPMRAAGPPDAKADHDDPNAWASASPEMGLQWLELTYDPPLVASGARVHEVNVAGCLERVEARDTSGATHVLWTGPDPLERPGVLELSFPATPAPVRSLRLVLDTDRCPGWCEIDAVELIGPGRRAWASAATASSYFGQP